MKFLEIDIPNCFEISLNSKIDHRGGFTKIFNNDIFEKNNINANWKEFYISKSSKKTLRGMHFQVPPCGHQKLIYIISGEVFDVMLDLRKESPTFGKSHISILNSNNPTALYLAEGVAHGFLTLSDEANLMYAVTSCYSPMYDLGIKWDSFGVDWPIQAECVNISQRDFNLPTFEEFTSPF